MEVLTDNLGAFGGAFWMSIKLSIAGVIGAVILGTIIAFFRVSPVPPLRWFGTFWVTTFRNMPLTVVCFFVAFGLPQIGINGAYFWFVVLALWLYTSAFVCEAIRAGINSVSPGQAEAARAIGLTFTQTLSLVVLPQAIRAVIPPLGSVLIAMMKNSAIAGLFGVPGDLTSNADNLIGAQGYPALSVLLWTCIGYWLFILPCAFALSRIEKTLAVAR